jgi:hypothetical protein
MLLSAHALTSAVSSVGGAVRRVIKCALRQAEKEKVMSLFRRAKEVTGDLAGASKRQAQRGKLEIELRRLESKISSEKDAIGQVLYPSLESGDLKVENAEVLAHMSTISSLHAEIAEKKAEIEALGRDGGDSHVADSMNKIDANATGDASVGESLKVNVAEQEGKPVDIGGQG